MTTTGIYGWYDSVTGVCAYVGQSLNIERRLRSHEVATTSPVAEWMRKVRAAGSTPEARILEVCEAHELNDAEERWVRGMKSKGEARLNQSLTGRPGRVRITTRDRDEWVDLFREGREVQAALKALAQKLLHCADTKRGDAILRVRDRVAAVMFDVGEDVIHAFPEWAEEVTATLDGREVKR